MGFGSWDLRNFSGADSLKTEVREFADYEVPLSANTGGEVRDWWH
jgi:hypothetical protein